MHRGTKNCLLSDQIRGRVRWKRPEQHGDKLILSCSPQPRLAGMLLAHDSGTCRDQIQWKRLPAGVGQETFFTLALCKGWCTRTMKKMICYTFYSHRVAKMSFWTSKEWYMYIPLCLYPTAFIPHNNYSWSLTQVSAAGPAQAQGAHMWG